MSYLPSALQRLPSPKSSAELKQEIGDGVAKQALSELSPAVLDMVRENSLCFSFRTILSPTLR